MKLPGVVSYLLFLFFRRFAVFLFIISIFHRRSNESENNYYEIVYGIDCTRIDIEKEKKLIRHKTSLFILSRTFAIAGFDQ